MLDNMSELESPIQRQTSLESFPLPPTTPKSITYTKSSPDLNREFRFPKISYKPQSPDRRDTVRRPSVPVTPDTRLRQQPTDIETTPIEQTIKTVSELIHGRAMSPPAVLRPLKYDPPPTGIPFKDFVQWDLGEEDDGSDLDGEDLILSHSSNYTSMPAPAVSIRPDEEGLPGPVRKYLLAQERDRVLREMKKAEVAVIDAGFDFGFRNTVTTATPRVTVPPHVPTIQVQHPTPLSEKSPQTPTFPSSPDSIIDVEAILSHSDSGIAIDTKSVLKTKSVLQHKSYHDFGQPKEKKVWRLTPSPDLGQESLRERKFANEARVRRGSMGAYLENTASKQRSGFWGKMKNTVLLRKG